MQQYAVIYFLQNHSTYFGRPSHQSSGVHITWITIYMKIHIHFWSHITHFFLEWKIFHAKVAEKHEKHIYLLTFFENRAVYKVMWENVLERRRPQTTIWRMRIACCISKAINTRSENVILIAFSLHQRLQERFQCYVIRTLPVFNKIQQDATVCRSLFTAKSLYIFRVSIAPIIRST